MSAKRPRLEIIGHGLAGAILAEMASEAGFSLRVWEDGSPASSRVAAGLFTPLTGPRFTPSWRLEEALSAVFDFYPSLEQRLGGHFFYPLSACRLFRSEAERREWLHRANPHSQEEIPSPAGFQAPLGACAIRGGGWVDLPEMLRLLEARRRVQGEWGKPDGACELRIWATGAHAAAHELWRELGWRNARGDILTLSIPGLAEDWIYQFGKFLLPLGDGRFRCGATYDWEQTDPEIRPEGRAELEAALREVLRLPFEVESQEAGVRPVALARVPVVGPHPDAPREWIFNGFGSKGVLYAPWMARECLRAIQDENPLPREVQAARRLLRQRERRRSDSRKSQVRDNI